MAQRSTLIRILRALLRGIPRPVRAAARRAALSLMGIDSDPGAEAGALIQPLVRSGTYKRYADVWLKRGFAVVPDRAAVVGGAPDDAKLTLPDLKPAFLPNLFLLGAGKSGTSTLYAYLERIPEVCMSSPKEPTFFECKLCLGLDYYRRRYFAHWNGERYIGDASPRHIWLPWVPERLYRCNADAKLIIMLRNPIERAYSSWWMHYSNRYENLPFAEAIREEVRHREQGYHMETQVEIEYYCAAFEPRRPIVYRSYLNVGDYMQHIERYLRYFPRQQLKLVLLDDLASKPLETIQDIEQFLGTSFYNESTFELLYKNERAETRNGRTYTPLTAEDRAWLAAYFAPRIERLAEFLNRDLSHWQ